MTDSAGKNGAVISGETPEAQALPNSGRFQPGNNYRFQPGRSGNPKGRPRDPIRSARKQRLTDDALRAMIDGDPRLLRKIAEANFACALRGNWRALWYIIHDLGI